MAVGQGVVIFGRARWWGSRGDLARGEARKEKPPGDLARGEARKEKPSGDLAHGRKPALAQSAGEASSGVDGRGEKEKR